jgi:uncharacterized protein (UPF0264 family)
VTVIAIILPHGGSPAEQVVELAASAVRHEAGQADLRRGPAGCWRVILDHASSLRVRLAGMTDRYRIRAFEALSVPESLAL